MLVVFPDYHRIIIVGRLVKHGRRGIRGLGIAGKENESYGQEGTSLSLYGYSMMPYIHSFVFHLHDLMKVQLIKQKYKQNNCLGLSNNLSHH